MTLTWQDVVKLFEELDTKLKKADYRPNLELHPQSSEPGLWYARLWVRQERNDD